MQIESIRLKNFKSFRVAEMRKIPRFCVLVGANGTGKSTLFQVFEFLREDGWYEVRRRGSHRVMRHPAKRGIVVAAGNLNADMKAGTLSQVLKQAGLKENYAEGGDGTD